MLCLAGSGSVFQSVALAVFIFLPLIIVELVGNLKYWPLWPENFEIPACARLLCNTCAARQLFNEYFLVCIESREKDGVLSKLGALIPGLRAGRNDVIMAGMYGNTTCCAPVLFIHAKLEDE